MCVFQCKPFYMFTLWDDCLSYICLYLATFVYMNLLYPILTDLFQGTLDLARNVLEEC